MRCEPADPAFSGTVFRFPLRIARSEIGDGPFAAEELERLVAQFEGEAHDQRLLTFLSSLAHVETYVWRHGEERPHLSFSCSVGGDLAARARFWPTLPDPSGWCAPCQNGFRLELRWRMEGGEEHKEEVVVASRFGAAGFAAFESHEHLAHGLRFIPFGAVAVGAERSRRAGRLFCFLPIGELPSGEAADTHGFFALFPERRKYVWGKDLSAKWNSFLFAEIVGPALADLVEMLAGSGAAAAADGGPAALPQGFYNIFPHSPEDPADWLAAHEVLQGVGVSGIAPGTALWSYLSASGLPLVDLPVHVVQGLCSAGSPVRAVTVQDIVAHIRSLADRGAAAPDPAAAAELVELLAAAAPTEVSVQELLGALWLPVDGGSSSLR
eukprot:tig00000361_g24365.t1